MRDTCEWVQGGQDDKELIQREKMTTMRKGVARTVDMSGLRALRLERGPHERLLLRAGDLLGLGLAAHLPDQRRLRCLHRSHRLATRRGVEALRLLSPKAQNRGPRSARSK